MSYRNYQSVDLNNHYTKYTQVIQCPAQCPKIDVKT